MKTIKTIITCYDSDGSPIILGFNVSGSEEAIEWGHHYARCRDEAEDMQCDVNWCVSFDENDEEFSRFNLEKITFNNIAI